MMVSADTLLSVLPPFNNKAVLIEQAQEVGDIVKEVVNAHREFAGDYDAIYQFFENGSIKQIAERLFSFCRENIVYDVETEQHQTTRSPAAILAMGYGDCKHYAGFIAGVLDAINRNTQKRIPWKYRFASYEVLNTDPGHVFVVVDDKNYSYWVDPVLQGFNIRMHPFYYLDQKVNTMLTRLSGLPAVGFDPAIIMTVIQTANDFIKLFGGGDAVPNYPVKTQSTYQQIKAHIQTLIPLPPTSVEQAKQLLATATQLREEAYQMLGGEKNAPLETYILLYEEIIVGLTNYIKAGGGQFSLPPAGSGLQYYPSGSTPPGTSPIVGGDNGLLWALGGGAIVWFLTKKLMFAAAGAAGGYIISKQLNKF